jgi:hypothetical protein
MEETSAPRGRIVLAIDTGSLTGPALEAAAALAAGLRAELAALFVEDERLLKLATLPFAHEIGFPSAKLQRIGLADMEKAFRVQADQLRRALEDAARQLALAWTLEVARGEILSASLARAGPGDLLVLGRGRLGAFALGGRPGEPGPFRSLAARPVTVLFDESEPALRALEVGVALAQVIATELAVLIPAPGPEAFRAARERAGAWLAEHGAAARYLFLAAGDTAALARVVRVQGAGALVWPTATARLEPRSLAELLAEMACPVVLLP